MPISEAQKRANIAYNRRQDSITLRPPKETGAAIRTAAEAAGQSLQGYILQACAERMARDQAQAADAGQSSSTTEDTPTPTQDKP